MSGSGSSIASSPVPPTTVPATTSSAAAGSQHHSHYKSQHHHHHHHHHAHHTTDSARRKKKHLPAQLAQLQLENEDDDANNFISSSRDASEEDNDEQEETFDDDASIASLRHHQQGPSTTSLSNVPISSSLSSIPPNDRDQALIDSAAFHQPSKLQQHSKPARAFDDRTPASSSPPRAAAALTAAPLAGGATGSRAGQPAVQHGFVSPPLAQQHAQPLSERRREASSDDDERYVRPSVGATLANASAALSSSSSAELLPKVIVGQRQADSTDASKTAGAGANLNLGSLPPANTTTSQPLNTVKPQASAADPIAIALSGNAAAATPKAQQADDISAAPGLDPHVLRQAVAGAPAASKTRKASGSHHASNAAARRAELKDATGDEAGNNTDGATPYDGDVEYAARTPVPAQIAAGSSTAPTREASIKTVAPSSASATKSTAPAPAKSLTYIQTMKSRHPDCHPQGDDLEEGGFQPSSIPSAEEIQAWVNEAIFNPDPQRDYSINPPPRRYDSEGCERPIRIYADGVYDLFHYAHALQLRQAKLSFPSVHLIVGVVSSFSCSKHKNKPVLTSQERYECVRNCRWVDEVLEDAPWVVDQNLIDTLEIDYIAHDDLPYSGIGMEDIYAFVKKQGRFLPTRRTDGVSTSELLGRIVEVYREGSLDGKLVKIGLEDLTSTHEYKHA
ncbi:related to choline-phosphate cytidylyltransferase [Melanopsichium pennsylvanicum]|uniref:choline-phosphate cytidylyltransferase n=2 Tax=Melanopsichium pennsylvanicum TaxID=63383 RepID=A0AAJ5C2B8_9BASI|nr:related to choline-phosphate cytidylyltransferase [Melanopsichium pennsylvanicum 4]SNX81405.1 related to choline-phosphate cytidylyltransferase [Melanopsichium pennsylvanicum]